MKRNVVILSILLILFTDFVKSQSKDNLAVWFGVSWSPLNVSNLPLYLRDVPYYEGAGGTINQSNYEMSLYVPFDFRFFISGNDDGLSYGIGCEVGISTANIFIKDRYEYGGTSTFGGIILLGPISSVGIQPAVPGLSFGPNIFLEVPIFRKSVKNACNLHASIGYRALALVNGWDTRYSDGNQMLKYNKIQNLAYLFPIITNFQFHFLGMNLEAGPSFLLSIKTEAGRDCDIRTSAVGLSVMIKMPEK